MRSKLNVCLLALVFLASVRAAMAQEPPPPPCCSSGQAAPTDTEIGQIVVDADALARTGLDRLGFVDRLASTLLSGRSIRLVLFARAEVRTLADGLSVVERRMVRVPRAALRQQDLDDLDDVIVTDGSLSLKIAFRRKNQ